MKTTNKTLYIAPAIHIVNVRHQSMLLAGTNPPVTDIPADDPNSEEELGW